MLANVVKTSFRFLSKNRIYTLINVLGLALGLAITTLIFLYVTDELSYDKFHRGHENIYRIQESYKWGEHEQFWATCDGSMANNILENTDDDADVCRIMSYFNPPFLFANARSTETAQAIFADSSFFNVFSFPMKETLDGDLLNSSHKVMISESVSTELFGDSSAVGKMIEADGEQYEISGVFYEIPENSHLHFDAVFPMELLRESFPKLDSSGPMVFYTYLKFENEESARRLKSNLQKKMDEEILELKEKTKDVRKEFSQLEGEVVLMPISDIHLKGHAEKEYQTNGNLEYIIIYLTIALFILLLASINYVNLATASSVKRAREVGVRKVLGAKRKNIFLHFFSEAFILVLFSTITALVFVELSFPSFNAFVGKNLSLNMIWSSDILLFLIVNVFVLTLLSGLYPSIFMSNFSPLMVLANRLNAQKNNKLNLVLRRILVISQFSIAVFLSLASFSV
ncbi:MAG: FtsX-like permease family protein [Bacteroidales bacterium]|nr:FtsX-like permease family protein [Bacteroidales bacterium]